MEIEEGSYIVVLKLLENITTNCAKENYIFQQRVTCGSIRPIIDLGGSRTNGNENLSFDKLNFLQEWRYATKEEIKLYKKVGKPCEVNFESRLADEIRKEIGL